MADDRKQARTIFRYVLGLIDNVPAFAAMKGDQTAESIEINGNVIAPPRRRVPGLRVHQPVAWGSSSGP